MATIQSQTGYVQTVLRLPRSVHAKLKDDAQMNGRTMNAEILSRIMMANDIAEQLALVRRENSEIKKLLREVLDAVQP